MKVVSKPIYILGTGLSHDGSSCLMKDGKIIVAIEKERLTRKKHDGFNDNLTIQYCLDAAGITFCDISLIVEKNTVNMAHDADTEELRKGRIIPDDIPRVRIPHHLAHAYSAIGTSEFDNLGIVVMDGRGASLDNCELDTPLSALPEEFRNIPESEKCHYFEKESYYVYEDHKLRTVFKDFSKYKVSDRKIYPFAPNDMEHSIAELYGGASQYVFCEDFTEGKLMGLAPYGKNGVYQDKLFTLKDNRAFINYETLKKVDWKKSGHYLDFWKNFNYYADIAKWVQTESEEAIKYLFNSYYNLSPQKNVAYAGGLALNAVCNGKLPASTPFEKFYFQPAASDNGLSIGCCYYGWLEVLKKEKVKHSGSTYFGKIYKEPEILDTLKKYEKDITYKKDENYIATTAEHLVDGKVIAWFQDESEFGPRALGHRSILGNPMYPDMRDYINREIKCREEFRPFAPSVLLEDADEYFDFDFETSYYMIMVGNTKEKYRDKIPSVVHEDNSARIQTVSEKLTPSYHALIKCFKEKTGIPILINTSLNNKGMPIVETPEDILRFFISSKIDVLVMQDYVITRKKEMHSYE